MNINLDKNSARSVLMDLWEQCARDNKFENSPKGGIYDMDDNEVQEWIIAILEGREVLSFMIDNNGFYQPCTRTYYY